MIIDCFSSFLFLSFFLACRMILMEKAYSGFHGEGMFGFSEEGILGLSMFKRTTINFAPSKILSQIKKLQIEYHFF